MLAPCALLTALSLALLAVPAAQHRYLSNVSSVQHSRHGSVEPDNDDHPPAFKFKPGRSNIKAGEYGDNVSECGLHVECSKSTWPTTTVRGRGRYKRNTITVNYPKFPRGALLFTPSFKLLIWLFSICEFIVLH